MAISIDECEKPRIHSVHRIVERAEYAFPSEEKMKEHMGVTSRV